MKFFLTLKKTQNTNKQTQSPHVIYEALHGLMSCYLSDLIYLSHGSSCLVSLLVVQCTNHGTAFAPLNLQFPWLRKALSPHMCMICSLTSFKSVFRYSLRKAFKLSHLNLTHLPLPSQSIILCPFVGPFSPVTQITI